MVKKESKEPIILINARGEVYEFDSAEVAVKFLIEQGVGEEDAKAVVRQSQKDPVVQEVTLEEMAQIFGTTPEGLKEILNKDYENKLKS